MKITILTVGKLKENTGNRQSQNMKTFRAYSKIEVIEVADEKPENMSDKEVEQVKEKKANAY